MTRALMALVVLALALPTTAQAQTPRTNAPPGNSAIDEYLETVPGAAGAQRPRPPAQKGAGGALSPSQRANLERQGPEGKSLADAIEATAPASSAPKAAADVSGSDGRSPASGLVDTVSGDDGGDGMGVILPAILIAALLAAVTVMLLRRRASS